MAQLDVAQFITRSDNFAVLLHDAASGATAAIDAPDADPIVAALKERGWTLPTSSSPTSTSITSRASRRCRPPMTAR